MAVNKELIEQTLELNKLLEQQKAIALMLGDIDKARATQAEITNNRKELLNKLTKEEKEYLNDIEKTQKGINTELTKEEKLRKNIVGTLGNINNQLKIGWQYLMQQDKIIKSTILNLGMSGAKAELMRGSFEQSAGFVARLGGTLGDIQSIMEGYADETGRARVLSAEMVEDITKIGKGTGLGIEQATKLGAQFEIMGFDAKNTMEYVQGIVDTSERMGVNTTKVLKNLNDNFKKLNTFTFIKGSKAMAEMAMNAEKTKVSMSTALDVAEATRSLDKVIELGANLQVMGGEFAKMDPFQWLYIARNEPEKMTEKLSEMTRGLFTFKKMSDGTFEKFISPADRDRLASVAQSLGIAKEEIFQIAERRLDMDKMNRDMAGMGLSKREKELVQGAAIFNKDTGKYQVKLAGTMKDISTLTSEQAQAFVKETKSLEARAKEALTFEEALKATLNELKSALLPILHTINKVLTWTRTNILEPLTKLSKSLGAWGTGAGLIAAAVVWKSVATLLSHSAQKFITGGAGIGRSIGKTAALEAGEVGKKDISGLAKQRAGIGAGARMAGKGNMLMKGGAGIGAAALGVGGGIGLAAMGIAKLATAIKDVDVDKLKVMNGTIIILGATMATILIPAMFALAAAGPFAALGLAALGAAAVGIGFGINLAAKGIGAMAEGLGNMFAKSKGAGGDMLKIAGGIVAIAGALALFNFSGLGLAVFAGVMGAITIAAIASAAVANSFAKMGTAMKGSKDDWIAVQNAITAISSANFKGGGMIADLAKLLKSPLKLEFANDGRVSMTNDITLNLDGQKFMQKAYNVNIAIQKHESLKHGKGE
jgi:hypothetical protein